ncbi:MAG: hypothetical protein DMG24_15510, partial [Acidobacteria bacterium]
MIDKRLPRQRGAPTGGTIMLRSRRLLRAVLVTILLLAAAAGPIPKGCAKDGPAPPVNLRSEYLSNPLGMDVAQPRFSWVLEHSERGQSQSAYQVLVAARRQSLDDDKGDQWDSGKVEASESAQVAYAGKPLESGRTYYWKVRYWDKQGRESEYSQAAQFEMGLLNREEWKGQWIGGA